MIKTIAYAFLIPLLLWIQPTGGCAQCGMDLSKYQRTQYEILWMDGTTTRTCGIQCGLTQQLLHRSKFKSSVAKDYYSGRSFAAAKGFYVFGSKIIADMAPGFIAFEQHPDAEKFQKEAGGRVLSFEVALSSWSERRKRR